MAQSEFRIGIVGVGRMGANMARRLQELRYPVVAVYDCDAQRAKELASELGCMAASTLADLAELTNTVLTVVSDDGAMRKIYAPGSADSLLRHATGRLFINCATLSPALQRDVHTLVEQQGGQCLEACMASSITQARQGTLYLMCGGRRDVFDRAAPLLKALSAHLRYIGPAGEAANVKALVNMVMNANTAALAEGLGLGSALGLDLTMLREVFAQTGANSRVLETDGEDMQQRAHDCYFSAAHAAKDSGIACSLAKEVELNLPVAHATHEQYRRLVAMGKGEMDKSAVAELTFKERLTASRAD
ncbi:MAG: NAD(P)-dependent oxidoreductase [Nitrospira sp.]|jgi:3-hydroxyisobutyrate dehydrogenase-like beta-hydroxyacid dehydrogenase|nr:NAD(P)-dependent oxidoreductase [Nitrospira sp.]MBS0157537.1 NAD(P)-dependent oxidoreductase [Nitrospira sp.]MBS0178973.1 NAD(P)-dependent oxidoreductase [Nitrospira sp.]MCC7473034.1 NAD(P)-dependent oxidoreductase [Candidatus Nomurabacteria bacterium]HNK15386.1 NAD(P)-dependent oxidoreductase [Nitrospira sp.]